MSISGGGIAKGGFVAPGISHGAPPPVLVEPVEQHGAVDEAVQRQRFDYVAGRRSAVRKPAQGTVLGFTAFSAQAQLREFPTDSEFGGTCPIFPARLRWTGRNHILSRRFPLFLSCT